MHSTSHSKTSIGGISRERIAVLRETEAEVFRKARPKSLAKAGNGLPGFFGGVPMHWMNDWPTPFPILVDSAKNATITDIDGNRLDDFCLGDTGSMFGHSPPPVARAIRRQSGRGLTYMLPSEDALAIGPLLQQRFGLPFWQIATTATDANRFALRVARAVTNREKILVFNGCYHGSVDETMVRLIDGKPVNRPGLAGEFRDLTRATKIVEFNDIAALEAALADRDVACVITEPVLTNSCMVLPEPGFHDALRRLTRAAGTLLLIDETHTISTGPGGYTRKHGLEPDLFVLGKPLAGGVPASVWGLSDEVASRYAAYNRVKAPGYSGMGTTLSANPLQFATMRAALEEVMTEEAYARMDRLARRLDAGLTAVIDRYRLPWHVARVGARVEFICAPGPLRNGGEAEAAHAPELEAAIHVALANRGVLIAPFHNMMLISPATTAAQVNRLITAFATVAARLAA
ncbi:MAG: aminotransferase class III-fold pyridoxal phosphate-dependent enzyme [Mesorhizobium sp.]|uniref:aspartate aminotransferase family protein n=5 Tax=Mesorhizobium TaxID=68287 RepID=UPI000F7548A4|nr:MULTISPECIES: aspartate aminotransferase family protein [unclassified Mesorhizobium]AZO49524.1 aspartate aminotransferase family protein [Mesorhizobium sp. M4B.F.Ca.ET.058.02.1.1]RWD01314.1 MAG: aminotransferase class III-fold pyridoxal phosphate-dependent enzyme [Mesorhizobium sp.]RWD11360.1 MAG: aminotransferase class III-fold pyridoxal phosphate-dependent enzyme [Mesorhizobium sp.]RWD22540.1 MAG: aminotransferase class III-fold pyridoxal phosphate-dependent enzyme [Mesorhizobium sp.]RWD5